LPEVRLPEVRLPVGPVVRQRAVPRRPGAGPPPEGQVLPRRVVGQRAVLRERVPAVVRPRVEQALVPEVLRVQAVVPGQGRAGRPPPGGG
uniref:hypothetical protein n=1 Tax=Streptomyces sp. I05A-00742 TaxID=2732853 RepID=UPI001BB105C8